MEETEVTAREQYAYAKISDGLPDVRWNPTQLGQRRFLSQGLRFQAEYVGTVDRVSYEVKDSTTGWFFASPAWELSAWWAGFVVFGCEPLVRWVETRTHLLMLGVDRELELPITVLRYRPKRETKNTDAVIRNGDLWALARGVIFDGTPPGILADWLDERLGQFEGITAEGNQLVRELPPVQTV